MSSDEELERHIEKNALAIHKLSIEIENINRQASELLKELNISPEQLTRFIEDPQNFTGENWNELIAQRKKLEEKLLLDLANIRNPVKAKKAFDERRVQNHWLFVR